MGLLSLWQNRKLVATVETKALIGPTSPFEKTRSYLAGDPNMDTRSRSLDAASGLVMGAPVIAGAERVSVGLISRLFAGFGEREAVTVAERSGVKAATTVAGMTERDVAALLERNSAKASQTPLLGASGTRQFPTKFVVKSAVIGGAAVATAVVGPRVLNNFNDALTTFNPTAPLAKAGDDTGHALDASFTGLGSGFANLFAGLGAGLGGGVNNGLTGTGSGLSNLGAGIATGAKSLILPALLIGGGVIAFKVLDSRSTTRARSRAA